MRRRSYPLLLATLALGVTGVGQAQESRRAADYEPLAAGTVLKVRLDERLNSAQVRPGHRFTGTVQTDEDGSGLPGGTQVVGVVRDARAATKSQPGILDVDFTGLEFPNGRVYPITGALQALDEGSVSRSANGRLVARRASKSDRMKWVGYGAGAGALIALLTKGNLLTNAILGAAGGYLYDRLKRDRDNGGYANVNLKEGAEFGVRLDQQFAYLPASDSRLDRVPRSDEALGGIYRDDANSRGRRDRSIDRNRAPSLERDASGIEVLVDDRPVAFGAARPMRSGGAVMAPLVPVMRATGARYFYNPLTREVSVTTNSGTVRTTVGSAVALVNGERVRLAEPVRNIDGVLYAPEQFIELASGMQVSWDDRAQTLRLTRGVEDRDRDRR